MLVIFLFEVQVYDWDCKVSQELVTFEEESLLRVKAIEFLEIEG